MNWCLTSFLLFCFIIGYQIFANFMIFKVYGNQSRSTSIIAISSEWSDNDPRPDSGKQSQITPFIDDGKSLNFTRQEKKSFEEMLLTTPNTLLNSSNPFANLTLVLKPDREKFCASKSTLVIAFVKSAVAYKERRKRIRKTWGDAMYYNQTKFEVVFVLGSVKDPKVQEEVQKESDLYGDIVQMNFIDSYRNLTYKVMAGFVWLNENCLHPRWVLEIDDDVLVNPFEMNAFLESELEDPSTSVIIGHLLKRSRTQRVGKWALTNEQFANYWFPPFVNGAAYFVGRTSVPNLIHIAKQIPIIPLDDVFFTGLAAQRANIRRHDISSKYMISSGRDLKYKEGVIFYVEQVPATFTHWKFNWNRIVSRKGRKMTK